MSEKKKATKEKRAVPALERGLRILECLAESRSPLSFTDLQQQLAIPKASLVRLLMTLIENGYVMAIPEGRGYQLGMKILSLGSRLLDRLDIRMYARSFMQELMEQTGETIELSILDNGELLCIEKIEGSESIRLFTQIGSRYRTLHASAPGKVHLAYMPQQDFENFILENGLPRLTENTITDVNVLKLQLEQIRQIGVAFDDQERRLGVRRFASPIFDCNGKKIAAIDLAGPVFRLTLDRKQHFSELVKKTAQRISKQLGFAGGI